MKYPKPIMRKSELVKMGFASSWLEEIYLRPGQKIAWKNNDAQTAAIYFDKEKLERERQRACKK
jgi:hypothetical protein